MNFYVIYALAIIGLGIQVAFAITDYKKHYVLADVLKGLAALCFVTTAFIGYTFVTGDTFGLMIVIGSIFGMIGDIVLNLRFIFTKYITKLFLLGSASFLVGHIFYIIALAPRMVHPIPCVIVTLVLVACLSVYFFKTTDPEGGNAMKAFGGLYLLALFSMLVLAGDIALASPTTHTLLNAFGALFFACSDIMLIMHNFDGRNHYMFKIVYLIIYYFGQISIALSLSFI
ncbi:MAG: lysoplasmalogenase [Lachnospiraceae bacterium]|nr:lysoplasmalogenase [Lachnospiraceae bacterium]